MLKEFAIKHSRMLSSWDCGRRRPGGRNWDKVFSQISIRKTNLRLWGATNGGKVILTPFPFDRKLHFYVKVRLHFRLSRFLRVLGAGRFLERFFIAYRQDKAAVKLNLPLKLFPA